MNIPEEELKFTFIRASGPGGQHVNKVSTAVLLRFNILKSTLFDDTVRQRLLTLVGKKLTLEGDLLIKACQHRSQAQNKQDARDRLQALINQAMQPQTPRKNTKPTRASIKRRLADKKSVSEKKVQRQKGSHFGK